MEPMGRGSTRRKGFWLQGVGMRKGLWALEALARVLQLLLEAANPKP